MATFAIHSRLRYLVVVLLLLAIATIWYWYHTTNVMLDYSRLIADEVEQIEITLTTLSTTDIGELTTAEASVLRTQLISHTAIVVDIVRLAEQYRRPPFEEPAMLVSLRSLNEALSDHNDTLAELDTQIGLSYKQDEAWRSTREHVEDAISELERVINI